MNISFCRIIIVTSALLLSSQTAIAADSMTTMPLTLKEILSTIRDNHPNLNINRIDRSIAQTEKLRIEAMLDPTISASLIASEEKTPVSSDFQASETRLGQLSGNIAKPLANGATLSANFVYSRTGQAFNSPIAAQLSRFNPAFRHQVNINYRHPLLKGADRPDYHQSLLVAEAGVESTAMQAQVTMHLLSLQAINAYYQLAADDINIHIAGQAVKRAKKLLGYQRSRETFGLIEKADRLQADALLAARKTDLQKAQAQRLNDRTRLNRLMRRSSNHFILLPPISNSNVTTPNIEYATEQAIQMRPELRLLNAQMDVADAQLLMALDNDQIQVDVIAEVGTRALATTFVKGLTRGYEANDQRYYASLSFELSDVLGRNSNNAAIRKAELGRQRILAERLQNIELIKDDIASASTAIIAGIPTLAVAKKQVRAEQRKFTAEMQRYRQGRSDTATLVQFEGELRNASLHAQLQRLTLQLAQQQLVWAQGTLLQKLGLTEITE